MNEAISFHASKLDKVYYILFILITTRERYSPFPIIGLVHGFALSAEDRIKKLHIIISTCKFLSIESGMLHHLSESPTFKDPLK